MYKIKSYLLSTSIKYLLINQFLILFLIIFINLIELSRVIEKENQNFWQFLLLFQVQNQTYFQLNLYL